MALYDSAKLVHHGRLHGIDRIVAHGKTRNFETIGRRQILGSTAFDLIGNKATENICAMAEGVTRTS